MKNFWILILCLLCLVFPACGQAPAEKTPEGILMEAPPPTDYEIALITSPLGLEDPVALAAWEGLQSAANVAEISHQCYQPEGNDYRSAIQQAVQAGAKLIICPSALQNDAVFQAQQEYPELLFLTVDYLPGLEEAGEAAPAPNNCAILFSEEEAGFLAGYAAVRDGYSKLGFAAERKDSAYGIGFLQGLNAAALETGADIEIHYAYTDALPAGRSILSMVYPWYIDGTEIVFACGTQVSRAVLPAAEASCAAIIGSDTDQHAVSDTFVFSAIKNIETAVSEAINAYSAGRFPAGQIRLGGIAEGWVSLALEHSRLLQFTEEDHTLLLERLQNGDYEIKLNSGEETDLQTLLSSSVRLILTE